MPKSKHRKNHKKKLAKRKQKMRENANRQRKFMQMMQQQYHMQQENAKREHIIETIYRNKPEIAKENEEGKLVINDETLEMKDGVLTWKKTGNPLLSGLEPLENYPLYTEELVNQFLSNIQNKDKIEKEKVENSGLKTEIVEDVESELGSSDDFELIEDEDFIENKNESKKENENKNKRKN